MPTKHLSADEVIRVLAEHVIWTRRPFAQSTPEEVLRRVMAGIREVDCDVVAATVAEGIGGEARVNEKRLGICEKMLNEYRKLSTGE